MIHAFFIFLIGMQAAQTSATATHTRVQAGPLVTPVPAPQIPQAKIALFMTSPKRLTSES